MDVKKGLFIVSMFFMIGCKKVKQPTSSENFDWLVGHWERIPDSSKIITKETWKKVKAFIKTISKPDGSPFDCC